MTRRHAVLLLALSALGYVGMAAELAFAQGAPVTPDAVKSSVDALTIAGPWVAFILAGIALVWLARERAADRKEHAADCQRYETQIAEQEAYIRKLHSAQVERLEEDAAALLAHTADIKGVLVAFTEAQRAVRDELAQLRAENWKRSG